MKNFKILFPVLLMLLLNFSTRSENVCGTMYPCQDTTSWGIGFIRMPLNNAVFIQTVTVKNGEKGTICNGILRFKDKKEQKINETDYVFLGGYGYILLKVYEIENTRYKICTTTFDGGLWVEFDELSSHGLNFDTYLSFINKNKNNPKYYETAYGNGHINIGVNLLHSCLNLRTEPSLDGKIVTCLKNNMTTKTEDPITHLEVLYVTGNWALVMAREYVYDAANDDAGEGCAFKVIKEYRGYVKIIDEKTGRPNIWYAVSSYL